MTTLDERFWSKVVGGPVDECWLWQNKPNQNGYGRFCVGPGYGLAHRWAYESVVAEIPDGLILDHLCRVHACINPWHLEPVTHQVNALRGRLWESEKTHCPQLHPYDIANTYIDPDGHRECRICRRDKLARFHQKERLLALAS